MVTIEQLRAFDTYLWLGTGTAAARMLHCNQSTISRQCRTVHQLFRHTDPQPSPAAGGSPRWGEELLTLERQVHQFNRFRVGSELRLHAYLWSSLLPLRAVAPAWIQPPPEVDVTTTDALALLGARVIDAFLAPAPACPPPADQRFAVIPLYATPLEILSSGAGSLPEEQGLTTSELGRELPLLHLPFVPQAARRCSEHLDAALFGEVGSPAGAHQGYRCYGNALTRVLLPELRRLDVETGILFQESLVVLREHAERGPVLDLVAALRRALGIVRDRHELDLELTTGAATP